LAKHAAISLTLVDFEILLSNFRKRTLPAEGGSIPFLSVFSWGSLPMETPHHLRRLAEWYRGFAEVGHTDHREWRVQMAEYLERRADELERKHATTN